MSFGAVFEDRIDAGRQLARRLDAWRDREPVVLGIPRGGVPVAARVARHLGAPLDVAIVRKLGVPRQPELAMGAIGENGSRVVDDALVAEAWVSSTELAAVEQAEAANVAGLVATLRPHGSPVDIGGRAVIVVDDGVATGATARAAAQIARARGASEVTLAVPVAPVGWTSELANVADQLVAVATPDPFRSVGTHYANFGQTTTDEVLACLREVAEERS